MLSVGADLLLFLCVRCCDSGSILLVHGVLASILERFLACFYGGLVDGRLLDYLLGRSIFYSLLMSMQGLISNIPGTAVQKFERSCQCIFVHLELSFI